MSGCKDCEKSNVVKGSTKTTKRIAELLLKQKSFEKSNLFQKGDLSSRDIDNTQYLSLNSSALKSLYDGKPENISVDIPLGTETLNLVLVKEQVYDKNFNINDGKNLVDFALGNHYFGVLEGKEDSSVILNVFKDQVTGILIFNNELFELRKDNSNYFLKKDTSKTRFVCNTDTLQSQIKTKIEIQRQKSPLSKYIRFFLDVLDIDNVDVITMFVAVKEIYINDPDVEINVVLAGIRTWTDSAPFYDPSKGADSDNLITYMIFRGEFEPIPNVDAYQFIVRGDNSGGIAVTDSLCSRDIESGIPCGICVLNPGITNFNVKCIAHELGHNIGSPHTFDCSWLGPTGASEQSLGGCALTEDNCVLCSDSNPKGTCVQPGSDGYLYTSSNGSTDLSGRTIMGYCSDVPLVFGPQPGALMRAKVEQASCLPVNEIKCTVILKCKCGCKKTVKNNQEVVVKTRHHCKHLSWEVICETENMPYEVESTPASGSKFNLGVTPVEIKITDSLGLISYFNFTVKLVKKHRKC